MKSLEYTDIVFANESEAGKPLPHVLFLYVASGMM